MMENKADLIYLDYASTTPLCTPARQAIVQATEIWGNPSSLHGFGRKAKAQIELARRQMANLLNVLPSELYFTSGATESANWVFSMAFKAGVRTFITSPIEHKATLEAATQWVQLGATVHHLRLTPEGEYDLNHLDEVLTGVKGQALVALLWVHNELGNITPIEEVSNICRKHKALLYIDGVQAIGKYLVDFHQADFLSGSAHKFYGPKGTGFLFIHKSVQKKSPLIAGGSQERSLRGGTEAALLIPAMAAALEYTFSAAQEMLTRFAELTSHLIKMLEPLQPIFNGPKPLTEAHYPGILNISVPQETDTGRLLFALDLAGVAVSAGSACNSGSLKPSHVISHLYPELISLANLRISLGMGTTENEIARFVQILTTCLQN
ncbi:cysteine desulfurase [Thermaurantimonas aggregans]|uniref:Cysteine desulfurase n=1 Tax=Thermaurantimonas aggregans TaxID=2173829 RepID=A0A401XLK5_9FLAO|nr:cysteine desulfurase family protein [Thermaurantimonas aggregans]MCX8149152.1 cysteine desulfurase [Thermaurantimonas aggregans]GCD77871.1 cysteine desulfurase [Thermaurantimonas aggregans]